MIINMLLRGRSLEYYRDIEDEPDIVYLVNDMHREVDSVEGLKDYLLDKNINLTMSLVKGSESGFLKINFFNDFNVTRLIRPYLEGLRQDEQDIPMKSTFLDNIHIPFMQIGHKYPYEYPGTGIAAIADAVLTHRPSVLNIVGLDFYDNLRDGESNYLVPNFKSRDYYADYSDLEQKGDTFQEELLSDWQYKMQNSLCDFSDFLPKMKINLWTKCNLLIDRLKNLKNITIKEVK
tara:strand:+ start:1541 stop:2242 length:702 start_codon:yes stop_codon:yes gene_type:complete